MDDGHGFRFLVDRQVEWGFAGGCLRLFGRHTHRIDLHQILRRQKPQGGIPTGDQKTVSPNTAAYITTPTSDELALI